MEWCRYRFIVEKISTTNRSSLSRLSQTMSEYSSRYVCLLVLGLFILSSRKSEKKTHQDNLSQRSSFGLECRNIGFINSMINEKRAFKNIDYINMCMFRKTRLCDCTRSI